MRRRVVGIYLPHLPPPLTPPPQVEVTRSGVFQFSPHRRGQRFPSEWLQSVLPGGPGESEQPLLGRRVAPSSHPWEEMAQGNKNMAAPNKVCLVCRTWVCKLRLGWLQGQTAQICVRSPGNQDSNQCHQQRRSDGVGPKQTSCSTTTTKHSSYS